MIKHLHWHHPTPNHYHLFSGIRLPISTFHSLHSIFYKLAKITFLKCKSDPIISCWKYSKSGVLHSWWFCLFRDIWQCLQTFLAIRTRSEWVEVRNATKLPIIPGTTSTTKNDLVEMFTVLMLRTPVINSNPLSHSANSHHLAPSLTLPLTALFLPHCIPAMLLYLVFLDQTKPGLLCLKTLTP